MGVGEHVETVDIRGQLFHLAHGEPFKGGGFMGGEDDNALEALVGDGRAELGGDGDPSFLIDPVVMRGQKQGHLPSPSRNRHGRSVASQKSLSWPGDGAREPFWLWSVPSLARHLAGIYWDIMGNYGTSMFLVVNSPDFLGF